MLGEFNGAETIQKKNYHELEIAEFEIDVICKEIDTVWSKGSSKEDSEKILFEVLIPKMEKAMDRAKQALEKWKASLRA